MTTFDGVQHFDSNFTDLKKVTVEKPNLEAILKAGEALTKEMVEAKTYEEAENVVKKYFALSDDISTAFNLIYINYTWDVRVKESLEKLKYIDEIGPKVTECQQKFMDSVLNSRFRKQLEDTFGKHLFDMVELEKKTFSPEIVQDLVEENKLCTEHSDLLGKALIHFRGKDYSIAQMGVFQKSMDRDTRKEANELVWSFYRDNDERIGDIYDRMVKVRTRIARKLGYENFLKLGYDRMGRLDWTPDDAREYREKILKYIVPIATEIHKARKNRIGLGADHRYYDDSQFYKTGNPNPVVKIEEQIPTAEKMYEVMNPLFSKYFTFMVEHGCLDLDARPGKSGGGYMEYLPSLKTSIIFANSNGTSDDIDTLTHEFGHALQGFLGGVYEVPAYRMPGLECCEMHSMSMEFLTYPWMDMFFKEATQKYEYEHLCEALTFIPYGCIVDAFQTWVYEHPEKTHRERKEYWRSLEKTYIPTKDYTGNDFLESGGYWTRQSHIFGSPMYYLDYTIAQVVALEFFAESRKDFNAAIDKYVAFDKLGGTLPFRKLLEKSGIRNPLDGDTLKDVANESKSYLATFDVSKLDV